MTAHVARRGRARPGSSGHAAQSSRGLRPARRSRRAPLLAGVLALLFAPDCTGEAPDTETAEERAESGGEGGAGGETGTGAVGAVLSAAVWTFAWDTDGATFTGDGDVEIETDLGYRVHLTTARILVHSVSLGLCDPGGATAAGSRSGQGSFFGLPFSGLPIKSAHAHAEDADPSMIEATLVEDLLAPRSSEVSSSFPAARYCRVHWLVARPLTATKGPDDVPMEGRSLFAKGTVTQGTWRRPLAVDTWWPAAELVDLADAAPTGAFEAAQADGEPRHALVTITRHLGRLFDGIDFEAAGDDQVAGAVLEHLASDADIDVKLWAPGDPG